MMIAEHTCVFIIAIIRAALLLIRGQFGMIQNIFLVGGGTLKLRP
jgi:hypothetical protein